MDKNAPQVKKPYAAPTLVRHGDAAARTLGGIMGGYLEYWGWSWYPSQREKF